MVAMFVREQDAIELFGGHSALLQPQHDLSRAQSAIDQKLAMIGRDQRAVARTPAPQHRETEHAPYLATAFQFAQINLTGVRFGNARIRCFLPE